MAWQYWSNVNIMLLIIIQDLSNNYDLSFVTYVDRNKGCFCLFIFGDFSSSEKFLNRRIFLKLAEVLIIIFIIIVPCFALFVQHTRAANWKSSANGSVITGHDHCKTNLVWRISCSLHSDNETSYLQIRANGEFNYYFRVGQ